MEMNALSLAQRQYLQQLNARCMTIERQVTQDARTLFAQLDARVQDPQDWLFDYEVELEVQCWLRGDDPAYQEDDDNILATLKEHLKLQRSLPEPLGIDDGINHNVFQGIDGHPMQGEFHCWLYHCLYDHTDLWFNDLLRIGHIWVELQVRYQHRCEVAG